MHCSKSVHISIHQRVFDQFKKYDLFQGFGMKKNVILKDCYKYTIYVSKSSTYKLLILKRQLKKKKTFKSVMIYDIRILATPGIRGFRCRLTWCRGWHCEDMVKLLLLALRERESERERRKNETKCVLIKKKISLRFPTVEF